MGRRALKAGGIFARLDPDDATAPCGVSNASGTERGCPSRHVELFHTLQLNSWPVRRGALALHRHPGPIAMQQMAGGGELKSASEAKARAATTSNRLPARVSTLWCSAVTFFRPRVPADLPDSNATFLADRVHADDVSMIGHRLPDDPAPAGPRRCPRRAGASGRAGVPAGPFEAPGNDAARQSPQVLDQHVSRVRALTSGCRCHSSAAATVG